MKTEQVNNYWVSGNDYLAIAINDEDGSDAHYFTPLTEEKDGIKMTAMEAAISWTSPGL